MSILKISKEEFVKRLKSFSWRAGMMLLAVAVDFVLANLADLNLTPGVVAVIGLVLGELSKHINGKLSA